MKSSLLLLAFLFSVKAWSEDIIKTNLPSVVTVNVSTNILNGDNATGCNMCYDNKGHWGGVIPAVMGIDPCKPYHPATVKWTITNVVKRVTITTEWNGKLLAHADEVILETYTNRWKMSSEWEKD